MQQSGSANHAQVIANCTLILVSHAMDQGCFGCKSGFKASSEHTGDLFGSARGAACSRELTARHAAATRLTHMHAWRLRSTKTPLADSQAEAARSAAGTRQTACRLVTIVQQQACSSNIVFKQIQSSCWSDVLHIW